MAKKEPIQLIYFFLLLKFYHPRTQEHKYLFDSLGMEQHMAECLLSAIFLYFDQGHWVFWEPLSSHIPCSRGFLLNFR